MFNLILVVFLATGGETTAVMNLEGTPDAQVSSAGHWKTSVWPEPYPDLASCAAAADDLQEKLAAFNAEGKWEISFQCGTEGPICDWLPGLYPNRVIPEGALPEDLQAQYDQACK